MRLNHAEPKIVTKPWGEERWECLAPDFCVKTIRLNKGTRTSFQYHVRKEEINFIRKGEAEVWMEDESGAVQKHLMREGDSFFVPAPRKHRVIALTDVEMFEVSNEFVDDVVRIEDDLGRGDGKIDSEHQVPAVLILAAGLGSRLKHHTAHKNKALLPIGNKAVISHIIEQFPPAYEIVVALGYEGGSLREYCELAHPDRKFVFVTVDKWDDPTTDPGHSALACKAHLQRPFYLTAVDSLIGGPAPHLDGDWMGTYLTDYPEKYATVDVQAVDAIVDVVDKGKSGFEQAFIGLAAVRSYQVFWEEIEAKGGRLIGAWSRPTAYPALKAKNLRWFDAGNLDDLAAAREHFGDTALNSPKNTEETLYRVGNRVLKFHPDPVVNANRLKRGKLLGDLVPANLVGTEHFIAYDWQPGQNLYQLDDVSVYREVLRTLETLRHTGVIYIGNLSLKDHYHDKVESRLDSFDRHYGTSYSLTAYHVNGVERPSLCHLLDNHVDWDSLAFDRPYSGFHGDLHFDNLIYDAERMRLVYVDWRDSFKGQTGSGDLYYDLGKLYAGCLVPFELLKDDANVTLSEGSSTALYSYKVSDNLRQFRVEFERWVVVQGMDLKRVKLMAALAFLMICPLHSHVWNKVLFFKGVELLHELTS